VYFGYIFEKSGLLA